MSMHPIGCDCAQCKERRRETRNDAPSVHDYDAPEAVARRQYAGIRARHEAHAKKIAAYDPGKKVLVRRRGSQAREWLYPKDIPIGAEFIGEAAAAVSGELWTKDADRKDND